MSEVPRQTHILVLSETPGGAKNTQKEFLTLIKSAIINTNPSKSTQRYQEAIQDTKTRLDFAVARGVWLMPSRMIINTESIVGYNNYLTTAKESEGVKLGVNNHINIGTKKASLPLMAGGPSKINPPNSHPSNPIHKQATEAQGLVKKKKAPATQTDSRAPATQRTNTDSIDSHHVNKALVAVGDWLFGREHHYEPIPSASW